MKRPKLFTNPVPNTQMYVYDIECYPNYTLLKFVEENGTFTNFDFRGYYSESEMHLKIKETIRFISSNHKDRVFVGFFNTGVDGYDDYMLKFFIMEQWFNITCQSLYEHSKWIINMDRDDRPSKFWAYWRMASPWGRSIDVYNLPPQKWKGTPGGAGGLKARAARLGWDRLQDLPYPPGTELVSEQMDEVDSYCVNDVMMTVDQYKLAMSQVGARIRLEEIYKDIVVQEKKNGYRGNPPRLIEHKGIQLLDRHAAGVCETVFQHLYANKTNRPINEVKKLRPPNNVIKVDQLLKESRIVKSEHPEIVNVLHRWSKIEGAHENVKEALEWEFKLDDLPIKIAAGGLHSMDGPAEFITTDDMLLIDIDVRGYYPNIMIENRLFPRQLGIEFVEIEEELTRMREEFKEKGDEEASSGLKTVTVTAYGKAGSKYSCLYDPEMLLKVIMPGQINLVSLIARLQRDSIRVISANTDGILCYVHKDQVEMFRVIYAEWEKRTGLTMEETHYSRYVRRDINNYIAIKVDPTKEPKAIGTFKETKGRAPIIANALLAYYKSDIQPEMSIRQCSEVKSFLYYFHANRGWSMQSVTGQHVPIELVEPQQSTCRWYQVKDGLNLQKTKPDDDPEKPLRVISVSDADSVSLMNDITSYNVPADLDRQWYIDKVWSIIHDTEEKGEDA